MRVTDLEKFSLEQIWRPYQTKKGFEARLNQAPMNLSDTAHELYKRDDWSRCVISRLSGIGVTFPSYINHPLVGTVLDLIREHKDKEA